MSWRSRAARANDRQRALAEADKSSTGAGRTFSGGEMSYRKYRNKRCVDADGNKFDSMLERRRWEELKIMHAGGMIMCLERQPSFELIVTNVHTGKVETACKYIADFAYYRKFGDGNRVIEDCKSPATRTPVYRLKAKLMKAIYGITIYEWPERKRKGRGK